MAGAGNKSLKAALFEAGLGERPPEAPRTAAPAATHGAAPAAARGAATATTHWPAARTRRAPAPEASGYDAPEASGYDPSEASGYDAPDAPKPATDSPLVPPVFSSAVTSPTLEMFKELNRKPARGEPPAQGVVSPPPWMRAARRGRRRARMMNTFGWAMTLVVAGAIIGVTGRYLAVAPGVLGVPSALEAMQARP
ncbi:hypothetical protein [Hyphomicrobium sp.]|uniref:hypothetical protein n=1 Tax=Hyphomicrobium sp. TaxID=82 RepID=UPI003F70DC71